MAYAGAASFLLLVAHPCELLGLGGYSSKLSEEYGQHVALFAGLTLLGLVSRWPVSRTVLACLLAGYALATEGLQALVPSRTPQWADVVENLLGIGMGFAVSAALIGGRGRRSCR